MGVQALTVRRSLRRFPMPWNTQVPTSSVASSVVSRMVNSPLAPISTVPPTFCATSRSKSSASSDNRLATTRLTPTATRTTQPARTATATRATPSAGSPAGERSSCDPVSEPIADPVNRDHPGPVGEPAQLSSNAGHVLIERVVVDDGPAGHAACTSSRRCTTFSGGSHQGLENVEFRQCERNVDVADDQRLRCRVEKRRYPDGQRVGSRDAWPGRSPGQRARRNRRVWSDSRHRRTRTRSTGRRPDREPSETAPAPSHPAREVPDTHLDRPHRASRYPAR